MNSTGKYLAEKNKSLSIYFTADYPQKGSTIPLLRSLQNAGVDIVEVGIPFSDPLADGTVIQSSSATAIANGFSLTNLFNDLESIKKEIKIPLVMMGYFNSILSFGITTFLERCQVLNIDSIIIPDLPIEIYEKEYQTIFKKFNVAPIFLITPETSTERLKKINSLSNAFIYAISDNSITGGDKTISQKQIDYFDRIHSFNFSVPIMIGFGISNRKDFETACQYSKGAIIGSSFIKSLVDNESIDLTTRKFITTIK